MQTRRLSPDALWIDIPLSPRTCRLVWHAMAGCGLQGGKINSYLDEHFPPLLEEQPHLVEGCNAPGMFADNARIQAQLTAQDGGTRLDFRAIHLNGQFDFGAANQFKRRLMPRIEKFLRDVPVDWKAPELPQKAAPPIASPTDFASASISNAPEFKVLSPIGRASLSIIERMMLGGCMTLPVALFFAWRWHTFALVLLLLFAWAWWSGRKTKKSNSCRFPHSPLDD